MADHNTANAGAPPVDDVLAFEFRGRAGEYFRIWIVNLALSILTLGIFSAWAKVRRERYFHGNTWVAGAPFQYLGEPLPILAGRVVAVILLAAFLLAGQLLPFAQGVVMAIGLFVLPWIVVGALRFRARNAAWSGVAFRFDGSMQEGYLNYLIRYLLVAPSLGLAYPYVRHCQRAYINGEHRFGTTRFTFGGSVAAFYRIYGFAVLALVCCLAGFVAALVALMFLANVFLLAFPPSFAEYAPLPLLYVALLPAWCFLTSRLTNLSFNATRLGDLRFRSTVRAIDLVWLYATNALAIVGSLGLLVPWARIRLARYRAARLQVLAPGSLVAFHAGPGERPGAAGDEVAGFFSLDLSL